VLGAEIDDGSIGIAGHPVRRSAVILTKFAVATALTMILWPRPRCGL
jgi:hypothetical protein